MSQGLDDVKAMVLVEPRRFAMTRLRTRSVDTGGWLAIEATGLSAAEVQAWAGERSDLVYPIIPGSQIVGRVASDIDESIGLEIGTRVLVEPVIRCGSCAACAQGLSSCRGRRPVNRYGGLSSTEPPGLWGGLAERLYLDPHARLHTVTDDIPAEVATFGHSLALGQTWAVELPDLQSGDSVLILGPGPRGLACLIAAQAAGAGWVGITGLSVDGDRLAMADTLGADLTVDITTTDLGSSVAESLGARPDVIIDVTANDPEAIYSAIDLVRPGGTIVLASTKGNRPLGQLFSDVLISKELSLLGALGASTDAYRWACRQLEIDERIDHMVSHQFPLDEASRAIQATAGLLGHEELISVAVTF
jgi:threonine dehydrogenase-like Zn-dependent dehydrogenase